MRDVEPIDITYAWFDTGLEYRATRRQLDYLEDRYGIGIERIRPRKTIPVCVKEFGQPFLSKYTSENMGRLQRAGFMWEDESYDALVSRYDNVSSALQWWTNTHTNTDEPGRFDIASVRWLKEFIIDRPPTFRISSKCCHYTKKLVARDAIRRFGCDLDIIGVRRSEGGIRAVASTCFTHSGGTALVDKYRPLFWLTNGDRSEYERIFNIRHSDCYEKWGFRRTGCAGCPYGRMRELNMMAVKKFEPNMYRAMNSVFAESYEYTRSFFAFRRRMRAEEKGQLPLPF